MRVLLTGATGFLGSHLAAHLVASGDIVAGTYAGHRRDVPGVELHAIEVTDLDATRRLVDACEPEAIIHLAGLAHVGTSWREPAEYFRVNVLGTETVVAAAGGARVVLASSAEVYGVVPEAEQPIGEAVPLAPASPYAITKAAAERLCLPHGAIAARTFNLVGAGQAEHFALPTFARQLVAIRRGEQPPVLRVGNLGSRRDFVHVEDGARAYRLLALQGEPGTAYNIASGEARSIAELLDTMIELAGLEVRVETDPARLRPLDVPLVAGCPERLRGLGWEPRRSVREALGELLAAA